MIIIKFLHLKSQANNRGVWIQPSIETATRAEAALFCPINSHIYDCSSLFKNQIEMGIHDNNSKCRCAAVSPA